MQKKMILVVDDDPDILDVVSIHLRDTGFKVVTCSGTEQAWECLGKAIPDLVLLDISLPPGPDGFHLLEAIRKNSPFPLLPVVMLTAQGGTSFIMKAQELKANDYLMKPFTGEELVEIVQKYL